MLPSTSSAPQAAHWSARLSCGRAGVSVSGFTWQAICSPRPWGCGPIEFGLVLVGSSLEGQGYLPPSWWSPWLGLHISVFPGP